MEIKAIRTEADYLTALQEVSALIDVDPAADSLEGERLDVLGTLVQAYEARHYPIDPPDPIEAIKFRMEQSGMTVKDLVPYIGPLNRVYEVLNYKRSLSLSMIRRLSDGLRIPAEVLIRESDVIEA
jgi:HTH-type transcriptional regulator/antitoxin HigA